MKVVICVLGCSKNIKSIQSAMDTWGKNLPNNISLFVAGDEKLVSELQNVDVVDCSVCDQDHPDLLPQKVFNALEHAVNNITEWDYILKCDDDTYVNTQALLKFTKTLTSGHDYYIGHACYWKDGVFYQTDVGPALTSEQVSLTDHYYAQGGAGYLISKQALVKSWKNISLAIHSNIPHPSKNHKIKYTAAEDLSIGLGMKQSGICLVSRPDLFDTGVVHNHWPVNQTGYTKKRQRTSDDLVKQISYYNKITTHHVEPHDMYRIHYSVKNEKILVATGFYYEQNKKDNIRPSNIFRGNDTCKYIHFFDMWYKHVKNYIPGADIFILDNGSPIPFSSRQKCIDENITTLTDDLDTNNNSGLFTYRYDQRLDHHTGWCRQLLTILKFAKQNEYDTIYYVESDALIGFNPDKYNSYDFVCPRPWQDGKGCEQSFMKITKSSFAIIDHLEHMYEQVIAVHNINDLYYPNDSHHLYLNHFAEVGAKKLLWDACENPSYIDKADHFIHDVNDQQLEDFLNYSNV